MDMFMFYITAAVIVLILKVCYLTWYCSVVRKRKLERMRLAREQAEIQHRIIQQQWSQQILEQNSNPTVSHGYNPASYTSIYWTPERSNTEGNGFKYDLPPPSYNTVVQNPPQYSEADNRY